MVFLMFIGTLQVVGDLIKVPAVKALALASVASPAPKVFTAQEGFETYSSNFYLEWTDKSGEGHSLHITPKVYYHGVLGPYNRRNAYGAALSYSPILYDNIKTRPMFESVFEYALCGKAPILRELGVNPDDTKGAIRVRLAPRQQLPEGHKWRLIHEITCP